MNSSQPYREHLVSHQGFNIYVRHYTGTGPAFVLMHGFPDNVHIYDRLIPALHGRQVITKLTQHPLDICDSYLLD